MGIGTWIVLIIVLGVIGAIAQVTITNNKKKGLSEKLKKLPEFNATQVVIGCDGETGLAFDEGRRKICLLKDNGAYLPAKVISYKEVVSVELFEDGNSITKTVRSSQIGGAVVGGLILGGVGAIIGGLSGKQQTSSKISKIDLRLIIDDTSYPIHDIAFLSGETNKGGIVYNQAMNLARHWNGIVEVLMRRANDPEPEPIPAPQNDKTQEALKKAEAFNFKAGDPIPSVEEVFLDIFPDLLVEPENGETKTLYDVLGVDRNATQEEIDLASIKLGEKYHPDRNPGDDSAAALFAKVERAYEILGNPKNRAKYDLKMAELTSSNQVVGDGSAVVASQKNSDDMDSIDVGENSVIFQKERLSGLGKFLWTIGITAPLFTIVSPVGGWGISSAMLVMGAATIIYAHKKLRVNTEHRFASVWLDGAYLAKSTAVILGGIFCGILLATIMSPIFPKKSDADVLANRPAQSPAKQETVEYKSLPSEKSKPATVDPRTVFSVGSRYESNDLAGLVDRHYPAAKFLPNEEIHVEFSGKKYVVKTKKLNTEGPAFYEILSVNEFDSGSSRSSSLPNTQARHTGAVVDCYELSKYTKAQGHNFIEAGAIVKDAERRGACKW